MSSTIGSYPTSLLNYARNGYAAMVAQPSLVQHMGEDENAPSASSSSTIVTFSDGAKAHLAKMAADASDRSASAAAADHSLASDETEGADAAPASDETSAPDAPSDPTDAPSDPLDAIRAWFDDQYDELGISSAMLDGKVAVDLSSQSREILSQVASNTDGVFSDDEKAAAAAELTSRFNRAMASHVVIARHTGDYAGLYQAASDYLDQAGDAEKATDAWKDQKQAIMDGLSAAKASFGKAPDTGNSNDPIRALLDQSAPGIGAIGPDSTTQDVAAYARSMLDDQENHARDNGSELVFDPSRKTGQLVDFSNFDNRTLATIVLNQDSSFSSQETYAAKTELERRTRANILGAMTPSGDSSSSGPGGVIQGYLNMSEEEKQVLGVTDDVTNKLIQSYRTMLSVQGTLNSGGGLAAYL
ncbi:hypothetical protein V1291_000775 [Nitrobacteraceae bacterium AZCC 1564]